MDFRYNTYCKLPLILGLIFLSASAHSLARPDPDLGREVKVFAEASYYSTNANYDSGGGSFTTLTNGRYYHLVQTDLGGEYWLSSGLSLVAQLGFARAESEDGVFVRTKTEPTDLLLGGRYSLRHEWFAVTPEFLGTYPFTRVDANSDDALTNEGALQLQAGAWINFNLGAFIPYGYAGYQYLDGGRASNVVYTLGGAYRPEGWNFAVETFGQKRVTKDQYSSDPAQRNLLTTRVNGGSLRFFSVNPSYWGARGIVEGDLNETFRLGLSFDHTLDGDNFARGWTAMLRLEASWGSQDDYTEAVSPVNRPKVLEPEPADDKKFEPESAPYDPTLFEEPKPKPKAKRASRFKRPRPVDIDKSLEDVQRSLEK